MSERRHPITERRIAVGLSQEQLAELVGVEPSTIWRWEARRSTPRPFHRPRLAKALLLSLDELADLLAGRLPLPSPATHDDASAWARDGLLLEPPAIILDRLEQHGLSAPTDEYLEGLAAFVLDTSSRYEAEGPERLATDVIRQRRRLHEILTRTRPSRRGLELTRLAAQLSAQLSYMAVNLGKFGSAAAYASEAFHLADEVDDDGLKAWVRGTQSFGAYYQKRYRDALDYAQDGLRYAGDGIQTVRLAINGEARALAQIHEPGLAEASIANANRMLDRFTPEDGMSSCISFDLYSEARVASNAATAYLLMNRAEDSLAQTSHVLRVVDASPSIWSRALVRLDMATAEATSDTPDVEHAVLLYREVQDLTRDRSVESVRQRSRACLDTLQPWRDTRPVAELLDEIEEESRRVDRR